MKTTEGMWWLSMEELVYAGVFVDRLSGDDSGKKGVAAISRSMRGNAMERQRGKNHRNGLQPSLVDGCDGEKKSCEHCLLFK